MRWRRSHARSGRATSTRSRREFAQRAWRCAPLPLATAESVHYCRLASRRTRCRRGRAARQAWVLPSPQCGRAVGVRKFADRFAIPASHGGIPARVAGTRAGRCMHARPTPGTLAFGARRPGSRDPSCARAAGLGAKPGTTCCGIDALDQLLDVTQEGALVDATRATPPSPLAPARPVRPIRCT